MTTKAVDADIEVENCGGLFLFRPRTDAGQAWLDEHTPPGEEVTYFGGALVVEHGYALDLAQAMLDDGLRVT